MHPLLKDLFDSAETEDDVIIYAVGEMRPKPFRELFMTRLEKIEEELSELKHYIRSIKRQRTK